MMKKFIIRFFIFTSVLLGVLYLLVFLLDSGFRQTGYLHYKEWNALYASQINANVLIQGNSRAYHHVNPLIVDSILHVNSFNLGMDGTQFDIQYARFKAYIKYNKQPDMIFQNVDEWTLGRSNLYIREQYIPYYSDTCIRNAVKACNILPEEYFMYPFKYMGCDHTVLAKGFLEALHLRHFENKKIKGYEGNILPFDSTLISKKHIPPMMLVDKKVEVLFDEFLNYCRTHRIVVVLFYSPIFNSGFDLKVHQNTVDYFQRRATDYGVYFLDYSQRHICKDCRYFCNVSHLTSIGSDIFTTDLCNDLSRILSDSILPH